MNYETIRPPMPEELEKALAQAIADGGVRVIVLQGPPSKKPGVG